MSLDGESWRVSSWRDQEIPPTGESWRASDPVGVMPSPMELLYSLTEAKVYKGIGVPPDRGNEGVPNCLLYINGLSKQWNVETVTELFGRFGKLANVRYQRRGRKFAHVEFTNMENAEKALSLNGCLVQFEPNIDGSVNDPHTITVAYAKPHNDAEGDQKSADSSMVDYSMAATIATAREKFSIDADREIILDCTVPESHQSSIKKTPNVSRSHQSTDHRKRQSRSRERDASHGRSGRSRSRSPLSRDRASRSSSTASSVDRVRPNPPSINRPPERESRPDRRLVKSFPAPSTGSADRDLIYEQLRLLEQQAQNRRHQNQPMDIARPGTDIIDQGPLTLDSPLAVQHHHRQSSQRPVLLEDGSQPAVSPPVRVSQAGRGLLDDSAVRPMTRQPLTTVHGSVLAGPADYRTPSYSPSDKRGPSAATQSTGLLGDYRPPGDNIPLAAGTSLAITSSSLIRDIVGPLRSMVSNKLSQAHTQATGALRNDPLITTDVTHSKPAVHTAAASTSSLLDKSEHLARVLDIHSNGNSHNNEQASHVRENLQRLLHVLNHGQCNASMAGALFGVLSSLTEGCKRLMTDKLKSDAEYDTHKLTYRKKMQASVALLTTIDEVMLLTKQPKHFESFSRSERLQINEWAADVAECLSAHESSLAHLRHGSTANIETPNSGDAQRELMETRQILAVVQKELAAKTRDIQQLKQDKEVVEEAMNNKLLNNLSQLPSHRPVLLSRGVAQGTQTDDAMCSGIQLRICALLSPFMSVHPRGCTDIQLAAYIQQFIPSVSRTDIEDAMSISPQIFNCSFDGHARRWFFTGFECDRR